MDRAVLGFVLSAVLVGSPLGGRGVARAGPMTGVLPDMPRDCAGQQYCTKPHDLYPYTLIANLLAKYKVSLGHPQEDYGWRQGDGTDIQTGCENDHGYPLMYEVADERGAVRVVVQAHNFTQQVRLETCRSSGPLKRQSDLFSAEDLTHHNITCKDNMMSYSFLVLSEDGARLESVRSGPVIPVYCACRLCSTSNKYTLDSC